MIDSDTGKVRCDFCNDEIDEDNVHSKSSPIDGFVIVFHACSKTECMESLRNRT